MGHSELIARFHFILTDIIYELLRPFIDGLQLLVRHVIYIERTASFVVIFALIIK